MQGAFGTLDVASQKQLTIDLLALVKKHNIAGDGTMVVPADYMEVIIHRRSAR